MSYDLEALDGLLFLKQPLSITLPNGHKALVNQYEKLYLSENVVLDPVLLVPHFKYNLISINSLTKQLHCEVVFTEGLCVLQGLSLKRLVAVGKEAHGLYILDRQLVKQVKLLQGVAAISLLLIKVMFHVIMLLKVWIPLFGIEE